MKDYKFVKRLPVARFFYKGNHTHPVRRTVLIIESKGNVFTGYELREGSIQREFVNAPIKSYNRNEVARVGDLDRRRRLRKQKSLKSSTLIRTDLNDLIRNGV